MTLPLSGIDAWLMETAAVYATALLLWLGIEDARSRRLRQPVMAMLGLPALALGWALPVPGLGLTERLLGALLGLAVGLAVRLLLGGRKRKGGPLLGGGDVRLLAAMGLWTGLGGMADAAAVGLILTLLAALPRALMRRSIRFGMPLGPGLAIGTALEIWLQTAWACGFALRLGP